MNTALILSLLFAAASAMPAPGAVKNVTTVVEPVLAPLNITIHDSCSPQEVHQLKAAFKDTEELVTAAQQHVLAHGRNSTAYARYFGDSPSAEILGVYTRILHGNKEGVLVRCDDADGNCAHNPTWAGHHRGSNATLETVICPPSFEKRLPLTKMCTDNYTVAGNETNVFWGGDLLHRLLHVPLVSEDAVIHYTHGWNETMDWGKAELGTVEAKNRTGNSDGVIFFALEVFANEVAVPGKGCLGIDEEEDDEHDHDDGGHDDAPVVGGQDCHTHADGEVHCV